MICRPNHYVPPVVCLEFAAACYRWYGAKAAAAPHLVYWIAVSRNACTEASKSSYSAKRRRLVGDIHSYVARPALSGIEGDDAHRIPIVAFHEVANWQASRGRCPLRRSRAKRGQVVPQNHLAPGMCHGWLSQARSKASDADAKLPTGGSSRGSRGRRRSWSLDGFAFGWCHPNFLPPPAAGASDARKRPLPIFVLLTKGRSGGGRPVTLWPMKPTRCSGAHSRLHGRRRSPRPSGPPVPTASTSCDQHLRLTAFFADRVFAGAGAQHAAASAATRLQSSGCPSQQSLTRNAITDRIPSTSER